MNKPIEIEKCLDCGEGKRKLTLCFKCNPPKDELVRQKRKLPILQCKYCGIDVFDKRKDPKGNRCFECRMMMMRASYRKSVHIP